MKKNSLRDKLRDVVYEKMKYSVEKHSQIVAQLRVLTDKHGNLLFRTILLFNATMTRKWCYLWMGLYEWLARIPICAFYSSSDKPNTDYNKALKIIFDNKDDLKPLYYEKERNYEFMVFYSTKLLSHIRKHSDDEEIFCTILQMVLYINVQGADAVLLELRFTHTEVITDVWVENMSAMYAEGMTTKRLIIFQSIARNTVVKQRL